MPGRYPPCDGIVQADCRGDALVRVSYQTPTATHQATLCPVDAAYLHRGAAFGDDMPYLVTEVRRPDGSPVDPGQFWSDAELLCLTCGLPPWPLPGGEIAECACGADEMSTRVLVVDAVGGVLIAQEPPCEPADPIHAAIHFAGACNWFDLHMLPDDALASAIDHAETCAVAPASGYLLAHSGRGRR